jgi:three-Cys-motif partner protein
LISNSALPQNFVVHVEGGRRFEPAFEDFRRRHFGSAGRLPPTFAFIDPFGWTGAPFSTVRYILGQPKCEVLVTFMYEEINRFLSHCDQTANFDTFFGCLDWRKGTGLAGARERNRFLHDLYLRQHEGCRGRQIRPVLSDAQYVGSDRYYLFYVTGSLTGLKKMKEAMWAVDSSGEFSFSDATDPRQMVWTNSTRKTRKLRRRMKMTGAGVGTAGLATLLRAAARPFLE